MPKLDLITPQNYFDWLIKRTPKRSGLSAEELRQEYLGEKFNELAYYVNSMLGLRDDISLYKKHKHKFDKLAPSDRLEYINKLCACGEIKSVKSFR